MVITADNAYSFGYGTVNAIDTYVAGARASLASQIFSCGVGPEGYTVPGADAPTNGYLYIVSWDDAMTTQGVLGQFSRDGATIYTGDPRFEVCATGIATYNGTTNGPNQEEVNKQIARCNSGVNGPTDPSAWSQGWVNLTEAVTPGAVGKLAVGETNDPGDDRPTGNFPGVCASGNATGDPGIDQAARWMWYNTGTDANPFKAGGGNRYHAYLIFRLRAGIIHM